MRSTVLRYRAATIHGESRELRRLAAEGEKIAERLLKMASRMEGTEQRLMAMTTSGAEDVSG